MSQPVMTCYDPNMFINPLLHAFRYLGNIWYFGLMTFSTFA